MENIKYIGKRNLSCNDGDGNCQKRRRRIIYGFYNLFSNIFALFKKNVAN